MNQNEQLIGHIVVYAYIISKANINKLNFFRRNNMNLNINLFCRHCNSWQNISMPIECKNSDIFCDKCGGIIASEPKLKDSEGKEPTRIKIIKDPSPNYGGVRPGSGRKKGVKYGSYKKRRGLPQRQPVSFRVSHGAAGLIRGEKDLSPVIVKYQNIFYPDRQKIIPGGRKQICIRLDDNAISILRTKKNKSSFLEAVIFAEYR